MSSPSSTSSTSTTRYDVVDFQKDHLWDITPQAAQAGAKEWLMSVDWKAYIEHGFALTATWNREPMAIGGMVALLPGVAEAWLLLGDQVGHPQMIRLYRSFERILSCELQTAYHRVQMTVNASFGPGVRMARMLGMKSEGLLKDYPAEGEDSLLFARTRNGTLNSVHRGLNSLGIGHGALGPSGLPVGKSPAGSRPAKRG